MVCIYIHNMYIYIYIHNIYIYIKSIYQFLEGLSFLLCHLRLIEDIFFMWTGSTDQVKEFLNDLSTKYNSECVIICVLNQNTLHHLEAAYQIIKF